MFVLKFTQPLFTAPLFSHTTDRLSSASGIFVDVIHTSGGLTSIEAPLGHVDFYPNGGRSPQPGCEDDRTLDKKCSHFRAHDLFVESIGNPKAFAARKCPSWSSYQSGDCAPHTPDTDTRMGEYVSHEARGKYYLKTRDRSPFSADDETVQGGSAVAGDRTTASVVAAPDSRRGLGFMGWALSRILQTFGCAHCS